MIRRAVMWAAAVVGMTTMGWGIGGLLDSLFWRVSYDYVYVPGEFAYQGVRLGGLLGTLLAAVATVGDRPVPGFRALLPCLAVVVITALLAAFAGGLVGGVWGKLTTLKEQTVTLAPRSRVLFCRGISCGMLLGAFAGGIGASYGILRERRPRREPLRGSWIREASSRERPARCVTRRETPPPS